MRALPATPRPLSTQLCTFRVADLSLGLSVSEIGEVLTHQEMTPVPCAPAAVHGLINLRGEIVAAIDLRRCLGLPDRGPGDPPMNVIVRSRGEVFSLLVDDIGDVIETRGIHPAPVPGNLPRLVRAGLREVIAMPDDIVMVLDVTRVLDLAAVPPDNEGTP